MPKKKIKYSETAKRDKKMQDERIFKNKPPKGFKKDDTATKKKRKKPTKKG